MQRGSRCGRSPDVWRRSERIKGRIKGPGCRAPCSSISGAFKGGLSLLRLEDYPPAALRKVRHESDALRDITRTIAPNTHHTGTIGHVAHGKSSTVRAISGVQTVRFKNELERNITIKLGYANAKVCFPLPCGKSSVFALPRRSHPGGAAALSFRDDAEEQRPNTECPSVRRVKCGASCHRRQDASGRI